MNREDDEGFKILLNHFERVHPGASQNENYVKCLWFAWYMGNAVLHQQLKTTRWFFEEALKRAPLMDNTTNLKLDQAFGFIDDRITEAAEYQFRYQPESILVRPQDESNTKSDQVTLSDEVPLHSKGE